jgi:Methyladenine glycosylase
MRPIPEVVEPSSLADYLEVMTRAVFQAGVRWSQIGEHWEQYRGAFSGFDPRSVAMYDDVDVDRILATPGILRMRRKVVATIHNARALLETDGEFGGLKHYLESFASYALLAKDLKRRFAFMGDMNAWYFLFRTGEPVPRFEQWVTTIPGEHPRMHEMVELARASGRSPERDA